MDLLWLADRSWPLVRRLADAHARIYRLTNGRVGHRLPGLAPMLLLEHVGARTGIRRTTPLNYVKDGPDFVLVASKAGYPKHPAWFHNLRANPDTTVQVGGGRRAVHARVASAAERDRLWPKALASYSGYRAYQEHTTREIPLIILELT